MVRTKEDKLIIEIQTVNPGAELQQVIQGLIYVIGKAAHNASHDNDGPQHMETVTDFMLALVPDERQMDEAVKVDPYSLER